MSLDEIGLQYGTDKASSDHDYLRIYEQVIQPSMYGSLLELGWLNGASVRTWREWLPRDWTVVGLDIEPKDPISGVNFVQGGQNDPDAIARAAAYGPFDVIIDDASHVSPLTIASFRLLWKHLQPGGLYFIEDLTTSYYPAWNPHYLNTTIMDFIKSLTDSVHNGHCGLKVSGEQFDIQYLGLWPGLCVVQKGNS
jgi:hypothetical protein